jgi:tRNA(adenine34) deaminase
VTEASPPSARTTGYLASFEPAMLEALAEARGAGQDVPVGAVVIDPSGAVIGRGRNRREAEADPTAHAEIEAIRAAGLAAAGWRLDGCTLVVTLEPCTMCAGALLAGRLRRLVYGTPDPRAGAAGSVWDVLHDPRLGEPLEVVSGVLEDQCATVLRDFFGRIR